MYITMGPNVLNSIDDIESLKLQDNNLCILIKNELRGLILNDHHVAKISDVFESEMQLALSEKPSSLQMENTYIPELPDGTEEGTFLALDLGGTNFRILLIELKGGNIVREEFQRYNICDDLRLGCGIKLFDYLAKCLCNFVQARKLGNKGSIPLGFTFSFPMKQHSLDSSTLVTWTKSFNCTGVVNRDVVTMLRESLRKLGQHNIDVLAILNDATGTLIQGARLDHNTRIGMIIGTGSNACYMEKADRVQHWEAERHGEQSVVIDIEWGAFGDNGLIDFIKTPFDTELDQNSLLATSFTFEKYIGGKYLGELSRLIMFHLIKKKILLSKAPLRLFPAPWKFGTDNISDIEQDAVQSSKKTEQILLDYGYEKGITYCNDDIKIIQHIAALISVRAARLVSICVSKLLSRMEEEVVTIATDGSVFKHHPRLSIWIEKFIRDSVPDKKFHIMLAEDGSGKGAALAAAIALRLRDRLTK